jgi:hypothetical protein
MENSAACQAFSKYPRHGIHQAVIAQAVAQAICAILGDVPVPLLNSPHTCGCCHNQRRWLVQSAT